MNSISVEKEVDANNEFTKITNSGFDQSRILGHPELPIKSYLLNGKPGEIQVRVDVMKKEILENMKPYPVQAQACRCETEPVAFSYEPDSYKKLKTPYQLTYLGSFRGHPITRLDIPLAQYEEKSRSLTFYTEVGVDFNVSEFEMPREEYLDYLILVPEGLASGVEEFAAWKRSKGYRIHIETLLPPANTLANISSIVRNYYDNQGADFVMIIGDETGVPMHRVRTSGSYQTPSDMPHFVMDGAGDNIPDLFYSRIAANTPEKVAHQLSKAIEFEQRRYADLSGFRKIIGVASNEGSNPSDDEYVSGIGERFEQVLNVSRTHLYENNTDSNPAVLNSAFDAGAVWMTYLGHGSGTSWPSLRETYSVRNIPNFNNATVVQPIIIDVACMNGKLVQNYIGTSFMNAANNDPYGAVAYYGGTVNISWHPPAVMAQGIAFEHLEKKYKHLGEALLAGQLYLAGHWNNESQVVDNFEWYHLQGDPGMNLEATW